MTTTAKASPRALVTGATAGIGEAIARQLASRGYNLMLTGRRESRLADLAEELSGSVDVSTFACDLTSPGGAERLLTEVAGHGLVVDLLVNNAGLSLHGAIGEQSVDTVMGMVNLNVGALTRLTLGLLPSMLERDRGAIMNVASVAAFHPVPFMGAYAATKAYVLSFTESLAEELRSTGVSATALCPGLTDTEGGTMSAGLPVPDALMMTPTSVAAAGIDAMLAGEVVCIPGAGYQAAVELARVQPRGFVRRLGGLVGRLTR